MRVIICGGRTYKFTEADTQWLDTLGITHVREGGARGAETCAFDWAWSRDIVVKAYPAQWKRYGPQAGPIRNQRMLEDLVADGRDLRIAVIVFAGGRGTQDMVRRAKEAGVRVIERSAYTPTPPAAVTVRGRLHPAEQEPL